MFTVDCPVHEAPVLIWPSGVDAVTNRDGRILVAYHCTCGHRGVLVTGRSEPRGSTAPPDVARCA